MRHEPPPRLDHENFDVYRCALEFLRLALQLLSTLPRGESELRSQLKRAAMSIPRNIAEGAGKPSVADRSRYHRPNVNTNELCRVVRADAIRHQKERLRTTRDA